MKKFFCILLSCLIIIVISCKKEDPLSFNNSPILEKTTILEIEFAKALAPALASSVELRKIIKTEALKMFDKDYDVLYQSIKDKKIGEVSVSEFISKFAESKESFQKIEFSLPLLTIFVPTVPNFSAENWNTTNEIPKVVVPQNRNINVFLLDELGNQSTIKDGLIPGFPIVVLKENERVVTSNSNNKSAVSFSKGNQNYYFVDECFNGITSENSSQKIYQLSAATASKEAYNLGMEWQRDHVYYGLTPTLTTGGYRHNHSEFITSFRMLSDNWLGKISDQTGDPNVVSKKIGSAAPSWTDGFFEFKVVVLINAKNGTGATLTKYFSAKGSDLADVTYRRVGFSIYVVDKITLKAYNPNIEIVPWDLANYGMAWKFIVFEVDPSEDFSRTESTTTTFGGNFGLDLGITTKIGLKFGANATYSSTSSFSYSIKRESDELGETILTFDQPIITGTSEILGIKIYNKREISTGWCSLVVEPVKMFDMP